MTLVGVAEWPGPYTPAPTCPAHHKIFGCSFEHNSSSIMMIDVEGAWDLLKGVPVTLWMLSSVMLLSALSPACAVHEFTAHRMQQFDLYGNQYGESCLL